MESSEIGFSSNENANNYNIASVGGDFQRRSFSQNHELQSERSANGDEFYPLGTTVAATQDFSTENEETKQAAPTNTPPMSMYTQRIAQPNQTQNFKSTSNDRENKESANSSSDNSSKVAAPVDNSTSAVEQNSPASNATAASHQGGSSNVHSSATSEPVLPVLPTSLHNVNNSAHSQRPLHALIPACVYLMSRVAVRADVEDTASCPAKVIAAAVLHAEDLGVANRTLAAQVFCLWMTSPLLEVQLKPNHKPFEVRRAWPSLLAKFSHGTQNQQRRDEPILSLQRNVFYQKQHEDKIKDHKILELLYEEARHNVLGGRYPCEPAHCIMLGGIQARIELGPYNPQAHTTAFFREKQGRFLPTHIRKSENWSWLPISSKNSAEVRLLEQFKRVPNAATTRKLMRKYLEFCWALPFYGAAFFHGQIEQPVRGLTSLMTHQDIPVLVAINQQGVYIIDDLQCTVLLGLKYEELSWDFAKPSREELPECLPCLFLQFAVLENGTRVYKVLQIFSKQAPMMDILITSFIEEMKKNRSNSNLDEVDRPMFNPEQEVSGNPANPNQPQNQCCLSNKLSRLTLATFDDEGRCIGQMGSFSISY